MQIRSGRLCLASALALLTSASASRAQPPPPAPAPAPAEPPAAPGATPFELSTLRLLRDKNVLSEKEYESAMRDLNDTSGALAADSTSVVLGKWATTVYGFAELDSIYDTTQSLNDLSGNAQIARQGSYGGDNNRTQFSIRNSRIGLRVKAPEYHGIRVSGVAEMDFLGTQLPIGYGQPYYGTESAYFTNPTFRVRHMYAKVETDAVDFLVGQYWDLFGWQSMYSPNTVEIQGVPSELYSRTPQIRISKSIKTEPVTVEVAVAAMRPPQRDSATPEGEGGLRIAINGWRGVQTNGATGTSIQPLSIAVTGDVKRIAVPEFNSAPVNQVSRTGTAGAIDAFIPVLPGSKEKMDNSLSLNGEFVSGYGIANFYTGLTGGVTFPALPNPTGATPAPAWPQDIDNGIATYDPNYVLQMIQWTTYLVGAQYYLPGLRGHVWVSGNVSHQESPNTPTIFAKSTKVRQSEDWFDVNLFTDVTPALRLGLEYANFKDTYVDGNSPTNQRAQFSAYFIY
jgi:hypothetical protein